jgi:hypothetical protein
MAFEPRSSDLLIDLEEDEPARLRLVAALRQRTD